MGHGYRSSKTVSPGYALDYSDLYPMDNVDGYRFVDWYLDSSYYQVAYTGYEIYGDTTLYANGKQYQLSPYIMIMADIRIFIPNCHIP